MHEAKRILKYAKMASLNHKWYSAIFVLSAQQLHLAYGRGDACLPSVYIHRMMKGARKLRSIVSDGVLVSRACTQPQEMILIVIASSSSFGVGDGEAALRQWIRWETAIGKDI